MLNLILRLQLHRTGSFHMRFLQGKSLLTFDLTARLLLHRTNIQIICVSFNVPFTNRTPVIPAMLL